MKPLLLRFVRSRMGDLFVGVAFGRASRLLPIKRISEDERALAFYHPKPAYKLHILVVPKKAIKKLSVLDKEDADYISACYLLIKDVVKKLNLEKSGYSVITNGGNKQEVNQLHFHLFSNDVHK